MGSSAVWTTGPLPACGFALFAVRALLRVLREAGLLAGFVDVVGLVSDFFFAASASAETSVRAAAEARKSRRFNVSSGVVGPLNEKAVSLTRPLLLWLEL